MSTIGTTSHYRSMVHLNMVDHQILHIQSLRLSISLQVVQKHKEELASRLRPSTQISRSLHKMTLSMTTNRTIVSAESNHVLVSNNIVQILLSLHQRHSLDSSTHLMSILEVNSQIRTASVTTYV